MRTYAGYLLLEDVFEYVPTQVPLLTGLESSVFNPNMLVVENNCGTTLGKNVQLTFESEGLVTTDNTTPLTRARITTLLSQGKYYVYTRHTSACISKGGVCATCYAATYPDKPIPKKDDRVNVGAEYLVNAEVIFIKAYTKTFLTTTNPELYVKSYLYRNGFLLAPGVDYSFNGPMLTLTVAPEVDTYFTIRFIRTNRSAYMAYLANTYSGYMLGMKPLPSEGLQVKSLYLSSELTGNRLQLVSDYVEGLEQIPKIYKDYIPSIRDPLEKALYLLAIFSIYYNAIT